MDKLGELVKKVLKEKIIKNVKETSSTGAGPSAATFTPGTGEQYAGKNTFNPNKKAKGTAVKYYYKLGYKDAPIGKSKSLTEEHVNVDEFITSLKITDPQLIKHISERITGFDQLETKLNELVPLITKAKKETLEHYKLHPDYEAIYGTDIANDYLDDLIKLFKTPE